MSQYILKLNITKIRIAEMIRIRVRWV